MRLKNATLFLIFSCTLGGCEKPNAEVSRHTDEIFALQQMTNSIQSRVASLEAGDEQTPYKLSDTGFGFVETETGGGTLQWIAIKPNGNGVQLTFKVGNPSTATWNKYTLIGRYGKLTSDGEPDHSTSKPFMTELSTPIPAGGWKTIRFQLDGPKADDVGYVYLNTILIANLGLDPE